MLPAKVKHTFDHKDRFIPDVMDVNGRKGRRVVCVLGKDSRAYKVFDLDPLGDLGAEGDGPDITEHGTFNNGTEGFEDETEEDPNEVEAFPALVSRPIYDQEEGDWAC